MGGSPDSTKLPATSCPADLGEAPQLGDVLEELVDQDGRPLPEGAGQELCLELAFMPLLGRDRLHPFQVRALQVVPFISAKILQTRLVPQLLQTDTGQLLTDVDQVLE
ncbi:hypothetical protein [Arthrobacter sp. ZGTC131]|uniref:hypothetical protein n=1 Tax=Arthrobacter sp. ZGTC131 TaxID=2058898 RepID=UPI0011B0EC04|nr:hypothetical protein [Arthrobacter sp. ZGTC131]